MAGKFTLQPCPTCKHPRLVVSWNWLRERRRKAKVTLREVARRLEFSAPYISDIEHGRRRCTAKIQQFYEAL